MTSNVFFSVSMSLDGYIAPDSLGQLMGKQWMELQRWIFPLSSFGRTSSWEPLHSLGP